MLSLALWLLASPPGPPEAELLTPRWALELELPRRVEVLGLGTVPIEVRARYLLRGPLDQAQTERCSLEVRSALATASTVPTAPLDEGLRLVEHAGVVLSENTSALLPAGVVRFSLKIFGLGTYEMSGETRGRLSLQGRRNGERIEGMALLMEPRDRVDLPAGLRVSLAPEALVRGRFVLVRSAAERCDQLVDPKGGVSWVP
jgi:hypothetical protein